VLLVKVKKNIRISGHYILPELVAQFCNPSYWEARTWDGLRVPGPQDRDIQRIWFRTLSL
jgi:hypothetical protein